MLEFREITKSYTTGNNTQVALDKVSLRFRRSEFAAILGQSGSGKTTFLNVIGGLDRYESGDLIISGRSTKKFRSSEWDAYRNNSIGFIFQNYNLINHLNLIDNVELGMTLSGVSGKTKKEKAFEVLEKVGLKDHVHKRPNQLSGGQMQRVAIARALANDPDIILADEPTGSLDSTTSKQILDLIKQISKDKLVIMVTHNQLLAEKYAERIVEFSDGRVISDSNPPDGESSMTGYKLKKTKMSFFTALKLSGKNIATKKWRTALTAFASSIGIIGIALILSLSNGFDKQITNYESGTMSNFPIRISPTASIMPDNPRRPSAQTEDTERFPEEKAVYPYETNTRAYLHENAITKEYVDYVTAVDKTHIDSISFTRDVNMNLVRYTERNALVVNPGAVNFTSFPFVPGEKISSYLEKHYDLLDGSFPQEISDLVLVLNETNRLNKNMLSALGITDPGERVDFSDITGMKIYLLSNDNYYIKEGDNFSAVTSLPEPSDADMELRISGIIRIKEGSNVSALSRGIYYSDELLKEFIENASTSQIVMAQKGSTRNILTGQALIPQAPSGGMASFFGSSQPGSTATKDGMLRYLGATDIPSSISVYPSSFTSKEEILDILDLYNEGKETSDQIVYTDMAAMITELSKNIMDAITIVLVAFAAISLVVSLIMIGIITYISVLERTKEIGILRALGARKKDISRVFNAETFITGSFSGMLGILVAYALTYPVNIILKNLTELSNVAVLDPGHAAALVITSILLTMLGGFIPAKMAAKKDPVACLRTE